MTSFTNRVSLSIVAVVLLCTTVVLAQTTEEVPAQDIAAALESVGPSDPLELEAFIDGMMAAHMPSRKIPAATIAVVKVGELFFAKGYGFADREMKIPVKADTTL